MQANYEQRIRLWFRKFGATRYIGHLDLARTMERALNRAKIPVAYTQGFNRRPRMQFAAALPLGYTSDCEIMDILLQTKLPAETVLTQLANRMAPGITMVQAKEVAISEPSLQAQTTYAEFVVTILEEVESTTLQQNIEQFLATEQFIKEKKGKTKRGRPTIKSYDLRPLVLALQMPASSSAQLQLEMKLALEPSKTGRPDEVIEALGIDPLNCRFHRTNLALG